MRPDKQYFNINVKLCVAAESLEEAQAKAALFMPWTTDGLNWSTRQHEHLYGLDIDHWIIEGLDSDEMEAMIIEKGWR